MVRNGEWSLLRCQARRAGSWMLLLPVFLAAFGILLPDTRVAGPVTGFAGLVLACVLTLGLAAPRHPGATAYLILCGFPRLLIWKNLATASVGAALLCAAGAVGGLLARGAVAKLSGLARGHWEPGGSAAVLMVFALAAAGAAMGLWLSARLVHAASSRGPKRLAAIAVAGGVLGLLGGMLALLPAGMMAGAALAVSAGFLWRSRRIYANIEPIPD